jgi:hypothetical protein
MTAHSVLSLSLLLASPLCFFSSNRNSANKLLAWLNSGALADQGVVSAKLSGDPSDSELIWPIILGAVGGFVLLLAIIAVIVFLVVRRRKKPTGSVII